MKLHTWMLAHKVYAALLVICAWVVFAGVTEALDHRILDAVVYFVFGWTFLGDVVMPWVQQKLLEK